MEVVTFYSYKGGVGRTLACANFGLYLAKTGRKVVLADMDFEAPGLDSKFPGLGAQELQSGLLEQFACFQNGLPVPDITAIDIALPEDVARSGGRLQLIPAGNYLSPDYYARLSGLRWNALLAEEPGLTFCIDIVKRIEDALGADILVIDSRTGLTEVGGLCTQILPDTVILLTNMSGESLRGTERIYERIRNSPIVQHRTHGRTQVDIRVVVARIPRPESLPDFEQALRKRLNIPVERFYYLFDQQDLSLEEYLALDRFEEHPAILGNYVELFASLNPEMAQPYIEGRLFGFRSLLTRRSVRENDRIIEELLTLFPRPEVMLEAARYYRLTKEGDAKAVANYIRYLDCWGADPEVLAEFAELCASVTERELKPREKVAWHLKKFGVENMSAPLLARFSRLCKEEDRQDIVTAIESDDAKIVHTGFRETYFRVLHSLGELEKIVAHVSEPDLRERPLALLIAEAFASVGRRKEAFSIIRGYSPVKPDEVFSVLRIVFRAHPDADLGSLLSAAIVPPDVLELLLEAPYSVRGIEEEHPDFRAWLTLLRRQYSRREISRT